MHRIPNPSEILALEFKGGFRRSAICSVSLTVDIHWSIFLGVLRKNGVASLPKRPSAMVKSVVRQSCVPRAGCDTAQHSRIDRYAASNDRSSASIGLRQAPPAICRASVVRYGQSREKRSVSGEPAGYELSEEPHALRLACLALCEKPNRSVPVQAGARHPHQQWVGISDEARQCRHPEPLPYRDDLRLAVRGPERNPRGANITLVGPFRDSVTAYDDPPDGIGRAHTPRGEAIAGHVDAAEQFRSLQTVKIERQGFAVVDDADRDVGLSVGQICQLTVRQDFHLDVRIQTREIGEVRHEQVCREGWCQRHPQ